MKKMFAKLSNQKIYLGFLLTFCGLLILGQLQRIVVTPQIRFFAHDVVLVAWLLFFNQEMMIWYQKHLNQPVFKAIGLLLGYSIIQLAIWSIFDVQILPWLYFIRLVVYFQLIPLLTIGLAHKWITEQLVKQLVFFITSGIAILGLVQYFILPDTRFLLQFGWDEHYYRLISTLLDPNFTALVIVISYLTFFATTENPLLTNRRFFTIPFFLLSLLLTYSRAGYLAFVVGSLVLAIKKKQIFPLILVAMLLGCIPFLPRPGGEGVKLERTASITARVDSNLEALQSLHPTEVVLGRGLYRNIETNETFPDRPNHATAPDSSFTFIFVSWGIVGVGLLLNVLRHFNFRKLSPLFLAALTAIATHAIFNNTLFYPWVIFLGVMIWYGSIEKEVSS